MTPYYKHAGVTIYHGDAADILPELDEPVDSLITDPVWPNNRVAEFSGFDPFTTLQRVLSVANARRVVIQYGCDSDPRFLEAVPKRWPFFRVCWLEYACPSRKGRILYSGDVAYVFGPPPRSAPGRRVISGRCISSKCDTRRARLVKHREYGKSTPDHHHPTPRRLQHVRWLIARLADGVVLDPFVGSGTTLVAAKNCGYPAISIEINERYCEIAAKRVAQDVLPLEAA